MTLANKSLAHSHRRKNNQINFNHGFKQQQNEITGKEKGEEM